MRDNHCIHLGLKTFEIHKIFLLVYIWTHTRMHKSAANQIYVVCAMCPSETIKPSDKKIFFVYVLNVIEMYHFNGIIL